MFTHQSSAIVFVLARVGDRFGSPTRSCCQPSSGAVETFKRFQDVGYSAFKLKIGFGDAIDYPNIESLCARLESNQVLMVDADQARGGHGSRRKAGRLSDPMAGRTDDGLLEIDSNPNPLSEDIYSPDMKDERIDPGNKPGLGIDLDQLMEVINNPRYFVSTN